jgi:hypothetical protein
MAICFGIAAAVPLPVNAQTLLVRFGDLAPGAPGKTFNYVSTDSVNATGDFAMLASFIEGSGGIYRYSGGMLTAVAFHGSPIEGIAGGEVRTGFFAPSINASGEIAFASQWFASPPVTSGTGIFLASGGLIYPIALAGDVAPGTGGGTYQSLSNSSPRLTDAGEVVFWAQVNTASGTRSGIFADSGATDRVVAFQGDPSPIGGTFFSFSLPEVNAAGNVVFKSDVFDVSVVGGLFVDDAGTIETIAVVGDPAPSPGGSYSTFTNLRPSISDAADVYFKSGLTGTTSSFGLFVDSGLAQTRLASAGGAGAGAAPGTGAGKFSNFPEHPTGDSFGNAVFRGDVTGGTSTTGIFLNSGGVLSALALKGGIAPDTGGATYYSFELPPAIGEGDDVVYRASFTGGVPGSGSGLFHVPEPAGVAPIFAGAVLLSLLAYRGAFLFSRR